MKARTMLTPRSVKHIAANWHYKVVALSKKVVRRNSSTPSLLAATTGSPAQCGMERYWYPREAPRNGRPLDLEEIRWLQSGVVVPHVTDRPLRRRRRFRLWAKRERPSRTRRCGAPVLSSVRPSSCGPSRTSAISGLLRKKGRGRRSQFAVPPASLPDGSTWTRPPRLRVRPPPPLCFR